VELFPGLLKSFKVQYTGSDPRSYVRTGTFLLLIARGRSAFQLTQELIGVACQDPIHMYFLETTVASCRSQSRQSTKLYLQSSEIGPPHP
jgi:hypothetical protein